MTALKSPPAPKATGIEARCAATGMRMTEQRRVIARVLAEAADHPDVVKHLSALAETMRADLGDSLTGRKATGAREPGRIKE